MDTRTYDDAALSRAVAEARSWRDVLRRLGLNATSAGAIRSVRAHAARLGLDHGHFAGARRWTDAELAAAVADAGTWSEVAECLGLAGGSSAKALKGHALRIGLSTDHLGCGPVGPSAELRLIPDPASLPRAGTMLAATWFALCGYDVSWPLEPCAYDLVVTAGARVVKVQVKTTRVRNGASWVVNLTSGGRLPGAYDPDDVDQFFVVDGELGCYLIPIAAVGGRTAAWLSRYEQYRLPPLGVGSGAAGSTA